MCLAANCPIMMLLLMMSKSWWLWFMVSAHYCVFGGHDLSSACLVSLQMPCFTVLCFPLPAVCAGASAVQARHTEPFPEEPRASSACVVPPQQALLLCGNSECCAHLQLGQAGEPVEHVLTVLGRQYHCCCYHCHCYLSCHCC